MAKESVLSVLESRLTDPAFAKDGNLLADTLKRDARGLVNVDRQGLVDALADWLEAREMVRTLQALILVADLHLYELRPLVSDLTGEVESGKALTPATRYLFESTLHDLTREGG